MGAPSGGTQKMMYLKFLMAFLCAKLNGGSFGGDPYLLFCVSLGGTSFWGYDILRKLNLYNVFLRVRHRYCCWYWLVSFRHIVHVFFLCNWYLFAISLGSLENPCFARGHMKGFSDHAPHRQSRRFLPPHVFFFVRDFVDFFCLRSIFVLGGVSFTFVLCRKFCGLNDLYLIFPILPPYFMRGGVFVILYDIFFSYWREILIVLNFEFLYGDS